MTIAAGPDFRPDEAQEAIARLAGEVLDGRPDHPWKALGQAGLLTLAVPPELGGEGLGPAATALLLIEIGRRAIAGPALSTLAMAVPVVARWGSATQRRDLLAGIAEGRVLTAALAEPGDPMPDLPATTATADWRVTGIKTGVPVADRILVPVLAADGAPAIVVADPTAPGVCLRNGTLRLDAVACSPLGPWESYDELRYFGIVGACALGDGALAGALDLTARHVRTREQFGRPLATFQAVAQQIADIYITSRTLHLTVLAAAWGLNGAPLSAEQGRGGGAGGAPVCAEQGGGGGGGAPVCAEQGGGAPTFAEQAGGAPTCAEQGGGAPTCAEQGGGAPMCAEQRAAARHDPAVAAQWFTAEAPPAVRTCHHLHGGLGLTADYPLHRHTAMIRDLVRFLGGSEHCLQRLGGRLVHRPD